MIPQFFPSLNFSCETLIPCDQKIRMQKVHQTQQAPHFLVGPYKFYPPGSSNIAGWKMDPDQKDAFPIEHGGFSSQLC